MRLALSLAIGLFAIHIPTFATAEEQTVRLSVPAMHCASCPYMVKKVISAVDGVITADASMDDRTATVTFDDERTNIDAITEATASIGYESQVISDVDS